MDEKLKILEMIESGKISAKEGLDLLKALEGETHTEVKDQSPSSVQQKYLRIRVEAKWKTLKTSISTSLEIGEIGIEVCKFGAQDRTR